MSEKVKKFIALLRTVFWGCAMGAIWTNQHHWAATAFLLSVFCEFLLADIYREKLL